jgi:hypothetical protein
VLHGGGCREAGKGGGKLSERERQALGEALWKRMGLPLQ